MTSHTGSQAMRALLSLLLLALAGCAYARDRAADAADIFTAEVGIGVGLHVDVKATDYLHLGLGYAHVRKVGFRGRDAFSMRDREAGLPVSAILAVGAWREGNYGRLGHLHANVPDLLAYEDPWRRADLEVGATLGFLNFRVGFSPGHLVDFLAGIFGFDPAGDDRGLALEDPAEPAARWLAGDLHEHCDPPDGDHAPATPEETVALAAAAGLDFAGLNPHFWQNGTTTADRRIRAFAAHVSTLAAEPGLPVVIAGFEITGWSGHALLLFRRPADALPGDAALDATALVDRALGTLGPRDRLFIPTHPRTRRLHIPYFPDWASPWDEQFEPSEEVIPHRSFDGLEALTLLHHLAELAVGRSGADLAKDDVFHELDRLIGETKRRFIATGGSDNHRDTILPTMWALSRETTRDAIFDALVDGRIAVGGDEACSFEARTDEEPAWRPIGADLRAKGWVELRWRGTGALVVDGRTGPSEKGPWRHEIEPGSFHFYRLEAGPGRRSRSCWIYVNRPGA